MEIQTGDVYPNLGLTFDKYKINRRNQEYKMLN